MKEKALAFWQQTRQLWASMSTAKRAALLLITAGVLAAVVAVSVLGSRENYTYLFTDLNTEDASAITTKLKELKVPYRLEAGGSAVQVPEERVHEVRLQLAGQGLPRGGGVGFELFDKSQFGTTEFEQKINLRRALEGELSRTISTISSVKSARVHLVLPERSVFTASKEPGSASVVLQLAPGRGFGRGEVRSVVHLVAAAVPGLSPDRVSVVSSDGTTLQRPRMEGESAGADDDSLNEREQSLSSGMEERVRALLERVVGPGHADVRVRLNLDSSARERTEEHFEPSKTALRSEQKTEERSSTEGESVAGVPGAQANTAGDGANAETAATGGNAARTSWTRNWEVDRVTEKTKTPAGKIARLSIAVLVDGNYRDVNGKQEFTPRDAAELNRLGALVKGAVGFDETRGDVIQIDSARFVVQPDSDLPPTAVDSAKRKWLPYAIAGGAAAVLIAVAVIALLARNKKQKNLLQAEALEEAQAAQLRDGENAAALEAGMDGTAGQLPSGSRRIDPEALRAEALELAIRDPATASAILREWLNASSTAQAA